MTFSFEKERITALSSDGIPMGHITFPQINCGLVNISQVVTDPKFREQGVADCMMDALLSHLASQGKKAALTCPNAQQYVARNPRWKTILPGSMHMTAH